MDYNIVSQGKTVIPGVDDGEEMRLTDVSPERDIWLISLCKNIYLSTSLLHLACFAYGRTGLCMCMSDDFVFTELTMLSNRIGDYPLISQGKTRIPGVNDSEEFDKTLVSCELSHGARVSIGFFGRSPVYTKISDIHMIARSLQEFRWAYCTGFISRNILRSPLSSTSTPRNNITPTHLQVNYIQCKVRLADNGASKVFCITLIKLFWFLPTEMCMLSNDVYDYYNVSQGKITIPNVDDGEECVLTDVSSLEAIFGVPCEKPPDVPWIF